jgi:glycerol-3-phosphate acyltransferase PlsY
MALAPLLVLSYLLGAFPSAIVIGRILRGIDIRQHGSGNAGATNAWRVLGWRGGLPVAVIDVAKGAAAAVGVSRLPLGPLPLSIEVVAILCGIAAVLGHVFPIYTGFRGGKGVATAGGMLLATAPIPVGCALGVFLLVLFLSGTVSLGSILAAWVIPTSALLLDLFTGFSYPPLLIGLTGGLALFILYTHRTNIARLLKGEERSFPRLQLWKRLLRH